MQRALRLMGLPANNFWKWHDTQPQKMMHFLNTPRVMCTQRGDVTKLDIKDKLSSSEEGSLAACFDLRLLPTCGLGLKFINLSGTQYIQMRGRKNKIFECLCFSVRCMRDVLLCAILQLNRDRDRI